MSELLDLPRLRVMLGELHLVLCQHIGLLVEEEYPGALSALIYCTDTLCHGQLLQKRFGFA